MIVYVKMGGKQKKGVVKGLIGTKKSLFYDKELKQYLVKLENRSPQLFFENELNFLEAN